MYRRRPKSEARECRGWLPIDIVITSAHGVRPMLIGVFVVNGKRHLRGLCTEERLMYPSNPSLLTFLGSLVLIPYLFPAVGGVSSRSDCGPFPPA